MNRSARHIEQVGTGKVSAAMDGLRTAHVAKAHQFSALFRERDSGYDEGVRASWEERTDRALEEILRTGGERKVYGPPPSTTRIPNTVESIDFVLGMQSGELHKWHGRIYVQLDTLLQGIGHDDARNVIKIVNEALSILMDKEVSALKEATESMAKARTGEDVDAVSMKEFEKTKQIVGSLADICGYLGYHGITEARAREVMEEIIGLGDGEAFLAHAARDI